MVYINDYINANKLNKLIKLNFNNNFVKTNNKI